VARQKTLELPAGAVLRLGRLPAGAQQIPHRLVLRLGHVDGAQLAGPRQARQLIGVAAVGFDARARGARDFRGRHQAALVTVGAQAPAERIAVRAGFVTKLQRHARMGGLEFLGQAEHVVVRAADQPVTAHLGRVARGQRDGDGIGVHIQADMEGRALAGGDDALDQRHGRRLGRNDALGLLRLDRGVGTE
jgi:hypothetical protein